MSSNVGKEWRLLYRYEVYPSYNSLNNFYSEFILNQIQILVLIELIYDFMAEIKSNSLAYFLRQSIQYLNTYFYILLKFY